MAFSALRSWGLWPFMFLCVTFSCPLWRILVRQNETVQDRRLLVPPDSHQCPQAAALHGDPAGPAPSPGPPHRGGRPAPAGWQRCRGAAAGPGCQGCLRSGCEQQDPGGPRRPDEDTQPLALLDKPGGRGHGARAALCPLHVRPTSQGPGEPLQGHPGQGVEGQVNAPCGWDAAKTTLVGPTGGCCWSVTAWASGPGAGPGDRKGQGCLNSARLTTPSHLSWQGHHGAAVKACGSPEQPASGFVAVRCHFCTADGSPHLDPGLITSCTYSSKEKIKKDGFIAMILSSGRDLNWFSIPFLILLSWHLVILMLYDTYVNKMNIHLY